MKKNRIIKTILTFSILALALPIPAAFAGAYISINNVSGNSLNISVSGVSYSQAVDLVYTLPGSTLPTVISGIGTAYGGFWNGTLSLAEYGIVSGSQVYARVGGDQSNTITVNPGGYYTGCSYYGCAGGLTLSPSSLNLSVGQTGTATISSGVYMQTYSPYISNNSNPAVASAYISNYQMTVTGISNGSTVITVCLSGGSTCGSLYVTVSGNVAGASNYQVAIRDNYFSPQTATIPAGASITWRNDGSMAHTVTFDNLNINSGTLNPGGSYTRTFDTAGTYTYHCNFHFGMTGTVIVTGGGSTSGSVWFNPSSPTMFVGQSLAVSINSSAYPLAYPYNSNAYYISSNSNPAAVSASVSGTVLNLYANQNGNSTITVCHSSLQFCGTLYATVGGGAVGNITFSPANPGLSVGQSITVSIYGGNSGGSYYLSSNSNPDVVTASVSGSNLNLYGRGYGSAALTICQSGYSSCGTLYASVSGGGYYGGSLTLSQNNLYLNPYQSAAVNISGSGNYYISSNSNPSAASAVLSGSTLNVYAYASGSASINVCQNYNSQCATLQVNVSGFPGGDIRILNTTLPTMTIGQYYSYQLNASGGIPPYTFSVNSGGLPAGLNLSASGLLSGVPQYAYTVNFSVRITDNQGRSGITSYTINGNGSGSGGVLGASTYKNGQLIKEGGTISIVYRNMKSGFASLSAFMGFGFKLSNVIDAGDSGLTDSGYTISASNTSHPWGSWVKSGQAVYFVHETGLIPVPDWSTFLNNGGQAHLIVTANLRDFQLPILSPMVFDDVRLR